MKWNQTAGSIPRLARTTFAVLIERVAEHEARVFIVEQDGAAVGWAVFLIDNDPIYVVQEQRRIRLVAELFVTENVRAPRTSALTCGL